MFNLPFDTLTFLEVVADETPSVQVVIKSDKKRSDLLNELEELKDKVEHSDDPSVMDRYNEVSFLRSLTCVP